MRQLIYFVWYFYEKMFFDSDSSSDLSDKENKKMLVLERKMLRQRSDIMNMPDYK